jgi:hypothetical protein
VNIYQSLVLSETIIQNFKPTRLCIKKINAIYYFCKSTRHDIYKYQGSGCKWKNLIKKYGKENIQTLWVSDWYYDPQEIHDVALHFSRENDIVNSSLWANLAPEWGLDSYTRNGIKESDQTRSKKSLARLGNKNPMYGKRGIDSPLYDIPHTEETKQKQSNGLKIYNSQRPAEHNKNISKSLKGNSKLIERVKGEKNPGFIGYWIAPSGERFDSSRQAAKFAGVKDKATIISWCRKNKNGWSFESKFLSTE